MIQEYNNAACTNMHEHNNEFNLENHILNITYISIYYYGFK
jgi:hypothetical protein